MANVKTGLTVRGVDQKAVATAKKTTVAMAVNDLLDSNGIRTRINELMGKRAPQFVGSLVTMINASDTMMQVFHDAPMTIIQSALRAATYDLPIDPSLGYAYIIPFNNNKKLANGTWKKSMEAQFIMGYKGMYQLALRTGVYSKLNVVDVREGEFVRFNRLTENAEFQFIEDEEVREKTPIIGYCGYFRLTNGFEKIVYWSVAKIKAHEKKFRKGAYINKVWTTDEEAMMSKTVLRNMIGKWGLMSIDYQKASPDMVKAAEAIATSLEDEDAFETSIVEEDNTVDAQVVAEEAPADVQPTLMTE